MKENRPLVSVITPAYNVEKYISETIESILDQTYGNFEFIIIDDASTDSTWEIVQEYARKDSRIKPFRNEKNLDIADTRNKGVSKAKGKHIVWQDADDISLPNRIEEQVKFMESNPKVGICGAYMGSFSEDGIKRIRKYPTSDKVLRKNIFKYSPVAQPVAIVRKEVLEEMGPYKSEMSPAEDIEMSFRIGTKYKFANVPKVLLRYRIHELSATFTKLKRQINLTLKIRKEYASRYSYELGFLDNIAQTLTWIFKWFPPKVVLFFFRFFRNILMVFHTKQDKYKSSNI